MITLASHPFYNTTVMEEATSGTIGIDISDDILEYKRSLNSSNRRDDDDPSNLVDAKFRLDDKLNDGDEDNEAEDEDAEMYEEDEEQPDGEVVLI